LASGKASPEARYEQHEAIELAFIAALQHLTPNQRAVLMLRDVLGFSADEAATMLDATLPSVNSALQRARSTVSARIPTRTQQETVRAIGDRELHTLVDRYVAAWERCDVDAFAALLVEDASFAMPPLTTWYAPREAVVAWARDFSLSGTWRWKTVLTSANAQPALGFYSWDEAAGGHLPFALNVLTLRDGLISDVTAFIARDTRASQPDAYIRFPEQPVNSQKLNSTFDRFGLPDRLA
jgi:RNA polymerase sigma-70 factor (ECF subfamily)